MSDIVIRGVPQATVAEIDRRARDQGLSRAEYLRRRLLTEHHPVPIVPLSAADWRRLRRAMSDLDEPDVVVEVWS